MRIGLPCSSVMSLANASRRSSMSWYAWYRYADRSYAVRADHGSKAAAAASIAARTSSTPASATESMTSPVAGFLDSKVRPDAAARHSPLMYSMVTTLLLDDLAFSIALGSQAEIGTPVRSNSARAAVIHPRSSRPRRPRAASASIPYRRAALSPRIFSFTAGVSSG